MNARDDKIRQVVAELDSHIAEVEAKVTILKALLADDEVPGGDSLPIAAPNRQLARNPGRRGFQERLG
jgi:hypothetical protein